MQKQIEGSTGK